MLNFQNSQSLFSPDGLILCNDELKKQGYINFIDLPDDFAHIRFLQQFGRFMSQYDGKTIIWSVKYKPDTIGYNSLKLGALPPHTECYELEGLPPKYLALWCIKPAECGGGQTTLADGYAFIASLTKDEQLQLSQTVCEFHDGDRVAHHPVYDLTGDPVEPIIRFSTMYLVNKEDPFIVEIHRRFGDFVQANFQTIAYKKNSLVIWDNWRMLHARTNYQDPTRELKRVWISKHAE